MGSFLSVTNGSDEPPRFIVFEYRGAAQAEARWCWSARASPSTPAASRSSPRADMDQMKFDMCGAASVFGTLRAIVELKAKVNVIGLVAACENMPSGRATKPGDVVKSMSGQTIEILNTDAEGRLILADALTYAERYEPEAVVDIATLTGAMVIALGHVAAGVFSNNDTLAARAGRGRRRRLRPRAGSCRCGTTTRRGSTATSPTSPTSRAAPAAASPRRASCRGSRRSTTGRTSTSPASAWKDGKEKGATGRPVPLLTTWLLAQEGVQR